MCVPELSCFTHVHFFATLWTVGPHSPLSMGFSRQDYQGGLPCPPPRHLPDPGIEPAFVMSPALAGNFFTTSTTWEAHLYLLLMIIITNTVDPQTTRELGLPNLWHAKNLHIIYSQPSVSEVPLYLQIQSTTDQMVQYCNIYYGKQSQCKWTCTIQTHVVWGPTVFGYLFALGNVLSTLYALSQYTLTK